MDQTSRDIKKVLEYIEEHGWCKYQPEDENGRVCIIGGLSASSVGSAAYNRILSLIPYGSALSTFNDADSTTEEDVKLLLKRAIYG